MSFSKRFLKLSIQLPVMPFILIFAEEPAIFITFGVQKPRNQTFQMKRACSAKTQTWMKIHMRVPSDLFLKIVYG
jgi:hypothetical protein